MMSVQNIIIFNVFSSSYKITCVKTVIYENYLYLYQIAKVQNCNISIFEQNLMQHVLYAVRFKIFVDTFTRYVDTYTQCIDDGFLIIFQKLFLCNRSYIRSKRELILYPPFPLF